MAEAEKPASKKSLGKKSQTVRERTKQGEKVKLKRLRKTATTIASPLKKVGKTGKKEYNVPLPKNKAGRILGKRVRIFPKFFRDAWRELRLVTWPTRKETIRLTIAVFVFAFVFAVFVGILDFGLDKLFRKLILNS